jgi:hypothetical protein
MNNQGLIAILAVILLGMLSIYLLEHFYDNMDNSSKPAPANQEKLVYKQDDLKSAESHNFIKASSY